MLFLSSIVSYIKKIEHTSSLRKSNGVSISVHSSQSYRTDKAGFTWIPLSSKFEIITQTGALGHCTLEGIKILEVWDIVMANIYLLLGWE